MCMGKREHETLVFIGIIIISLVLGNTVLPQWLGSTGYLNIFKPLFWLALSLYVWKQPRCRFKGKLKLYNFILLWSAICGIIYISVYFSGGFLDGIGASPYTKQIGGILTNVLCFGSVMAMMEWVRNYIINRVKKEYLIFFSVITIIVFTLYRLNLRIIGSLETWQQVVQYLGEYALPEIMSNVLLTYLVYIGGPYPAIIYVVIANLPVWVVPVLPNLRWITKAFIGTMTPVVFILVIRQVYKKQSREVRLRERKTENPYSWISVSVVSIALIWFAVGVFPIFPTVILTGSMEPVIYPGDVVVIQKTEANKIKVGDVIQYWTGEIFIIHRVIAVEGPAGELRTKGDNNSAPDSALVTSGQVRGKMIAVIPKLGILSTLLRANNQIPTEKVEF